MASHRRSPRFVMVLSLAAALDGGCSLNLGPRPEEGSGGTTSTGTTSSVTTNGSSADASSTGAGGAMGIREWPSGAGAISRGGRGGQVIFVSRLDDPLPPADMTGTLRACAEGQGPRTCVFTVGGTIALQRKLDIASPSQGTLTIACQTAPGDGIQITRGDPDSVDHIVVLYQTHDVVIEGCRLRGNANGGAIGIFDATKVLIDHVSFARTTGISISDDPDVVGETSAITVSNSIIAESLAYHQSASVSGASEASSAAIVDVDFHHNLIMSTDGFTPMARAGSVRIVNNLIHNHHGRATVLGDGTGADVISNVYSSGPFSLLYAEVMIWEAHMSPGAGPPGSPSVHLHDNLGFAAPEVPADPWELARAGTSETSVIGDPVPMAWKRAKPLPALDYPISVTPASTLAAVGLPAVGASRQLKCEGGWQDKIDVMDRRLLDEWQQRQGIADPIPAVGELPMLSSGTPCPDEDKDGLPDPWEMKMGRDPAIPDATAKIESDRTYLEAYLAGY